jgi:large subunit ribosomal protein L10
MSEAKELRAKTIEEIKSKIENSNGFIVVSYKGISVNDDVALRAKLRAANVEYKVLKNRLVNKALEELGIEGFTNDLQEPNAFAFANGEITAAAKVFKDTMANVPSLSVRVKELCTYQGHFLLCRRFFQFRRVIYTFL